MFAQFLPPSVSEIQAPEAIALLHRIQRRVVEVRCGQRTMTIATAAADYIPHTTLSSAHASPILLLHGFDSSLLEFRRLLPVLVNHQETWVLDLFGSGFTEYIPPIAVNPQTIRQHLISFVETWIQRPVVLVGASLGGAVAIDFSLHYPNWVKSLVLIDSVGFSGSFPMGQFLPHSLISLGVELALFP